MIRDRQQRTQMVGMHSLRGNLPVLLHSSRSKVVQMGIAR